MSSNLIAWFEIYVQDIGRARSFYEHVLGCTLSRLPVEAVEMWAFPGATPEAAAPGALMQVPGLPSGGNSCVLYFDCADCGETAARVEAAGGQLRRPKMSIGSYGFVALALDTEGNLFGLRSSV
jgi:predicted enzyme related to lactoylglutathione lyase